MKKFVRKKFTAMRSYFEYTVQRLRNSDTHNSNGNNFAFSGLTLAHLVDLKYK